MMSTDGDSPEWVLGVASALKRYLREAADLPVVTDEDGAGVGPPGWSARLPGSDPAGRTPWINMLDIVVGCVGKVIVLAFRWKPDEGLGETYILPMTTIEADPMLGSDALITRLDVFLDSPWRESHTYPLGNGTSVVVMLPKGANRSPL